MIGQLRGIIIEKIPPCIVLDVNGVGYEILAPMSTFYQLNEESPTTTTTFLTHMIVREDAQLLYGFATKNERRLFRALIKVNGVGPKLALTILSGMEPLQFITCINENNIARLTQVPGIGKKTAERLIIETRDALKDWIQTTSETTTSSATLLSTKADAINALIALGYKQTEAEKTVTSVYQADHTSEELIRLALRAMTQGATA